MSPWMQATGSMAGSRQRQHEPKGRKDSRERRAEPVPQAARARVRSWDVKTARLVFLLPVTLEESWLWRGGRGAHCATFWRCWCIGDGVLVWRTAGYGIDTNTLDCQKFQGGATAGSFCGDGGWALWAVTWLVAFVPAHDPWHRRIPDTPVTCSTLSVSRLFHCISLSATPSHLSLVMGYAEKG